MERVKQLVPFDEILKEFARLYVQEYGVVQFKEIASKVHTSSTIKIFLIETNSVKVKPLRDDILGVIHSIFYFTFAKAEKISIGSAILLSKWHQEVAIPNGINDNSHLNQTLFDIIDKCNGFKLHINNSLNFFERFYDIINERYNAIEKNIEVEYKSEIHFDTLMCKAIIGQIKTEFRTPERLEIINILPNEWSLEKIDPHKGAAFYSNRLEEKILVSFPYKIGTNIKVRDKHNAFSSDFHLRITSIELQRIRDVDQFDACKEGYGIYKERINKLLSEYYDADAELCLFEEDWAKVYGDGCKAVNQWIWVFGIIYVSELSI